MSSLGFPISFLTYEKLIKLNTIDIQAPKIETWLKSSAARISQGPGSLLGSHSRRCPELERFGVFMDVVRVVVCLVSEPLPAEWLAEEDHRARWTNCKLMTLNS